MLSATCTKKVNNKTSERFIDFGPDIKYEHMGFFLDLNGQYWIICWMLNMSFQIWPLRTYVWSIQLLVYNQN